MFKCANFLFIACLILLACGQNHSSDKQAATRKLRNRNTAFDTSVIAVIPMNEDSSWLFKEGTPMKLTNDDLQIIDSLLEECVQTNNATLDTANKSSVYIDLNKYRRQYVPYTDSNGVRRVYVNCFCKLNSINKNWKKKLIQLNNAGSCFFQVNINLTKLEFEQFPTNGYGLKLLPFLGRKLI